MKIRRVDILAATLLTLAGLSSLAGMSSLASAAMVTSGARVLSGELVVTDAASNRFRLVGHGGTFAAPPGTAAQAFDGKAVQVEISRDGRVLEISEMPISIEPVTHGFEVVSGQLVVLDAGVRTFTLAGDSRSYMAPAAIDMWPYAGRMVDVRLDEQGRVIDIGFSGRAPEAPLTGTSCSYVGHGYSDGVSLCQSGIRYRCEGGTWRNLGVACAGIGAQPCDLDGLTYYEGATRCEHGSQFLCEHGRWRSLGTVCAAEGSAALEPPRPQICMLSDASIADGSSICRHGTTFRCARGEWVNVGSACQ